jgi:hypothetical protein
MVAWIVRRTWNAVTDVAALPEEARNRSALARSAKPRSTAMLLAMLDAAENIYPAHDSELPNTGVLYGDAELEFKKALEQRKLIPRPDGRFDVADVVRLWPGAGKGNAEKNYLRTADVETLSRVIREVDVQGHTLAYICKKAGIKCADKKKRKALIHAAIKHARRYLGDGVPEDLISPVEFAEIALKDLKRPGLSLDAREDSERLAFGETLTPEEREVFNHQTHHQHLSLMRDEKTISASLDTRRSKKYLSPIERKTQSARVDAMEEKASRTRAKPESN